MNAIDPERVDAVIKAIALDLRSSHPQLSTDLVERVVLQAAIELAGASNTAALPALIRRRAGARLAAHSGRPTPIQTSKRVSPQP